MKTLIIGAREGSLGEAIYRNMAPKFPVVGGSGDHYLYTAGISNEMLHLDVLLGGNVREFLIHRPDFDNIICTVGVNRPYTLGTETAYRDMLQSMMVNVIGVFEVLNQWVKNCCASDVNLYRRQFVVISSNSATIPRSNSAPYCASKAALSMMVRCVARDLDKKMVVTNEEKRWPSVQPLVYGYEFGMLEGTPMTRQGSRQAESRMIRQPRGIPVDWAAEQVVHHLLNPDDALSGCLLRYDGGEV